MGNKDSKREPKTHITAKANSNRKAEKSFNKMNIERTMADCLPKFRLPRRTSLPSLNSDCSKLMQRMNELQEVNERRKINFMNVSKNYGYRNLMRRCLQRPKDGTKLQKVNLISLIMADHAAFKYDEQSLNIKVGENRIEQNRQQTYSTCIICGRNHERLIDKSVKARQRPISLFVTYSRNSRFDNATQTSDHKIEDTKRVSSDEDTSTLKDYPSCNVSSNVSNDHLNSSDNSTLTDFESLRNRWASELENQQHMRRFNTYEETNVGTHRNHHCQRELGLSFYRRRRISNRGRHINFFSNQRYTFVTNMHQRERSALLSETNEKKHELTDNEQKPEPWTTVQSLMFSIFVFIVLLTILYWIKYAAVELADLTLHYLKR